MIEKGGSYSMDEESTYNRPSRYAMIPEWVIYHPDLTGSDVRVYAVMARMADAEGRCYPKADTVASRLGVSDDTVRRSVARLEAAGALRVTPKMGPNGYRANDYLIAGDTPLGVEVDPLRVEQREAGVRSSAESPRLRKSAESESATVRSRSPQPCGDKEGEPSLNESQKNENQSGAAVAVAGDTIKDQAHRLAQISFEQNPKPVCRGGFVAVMGLFKSFIKAGHRPEDLERAIRSGVFTTWTLAAMTVALDRATAKPKPPRSERTLADKSAQYERVLNRLGAAS